MAHPLKLTASLIEYNSKSKSLTMECKVFRDDFQKSLRKSVLKGVDKSDVTREGKIKIIESYFRKYYSIIHNGNILPLRLESSKYLRGQNVIVIAFKPNSLDLKTGDKLSIRNTLFFEDFKHSQSNRIVVRIPSFSIDEKHISTLNNYHIDYTLGASTE